MAQHTTSSDIIQLGEGVTLEWLDDGNIAAFTMSNQPVTRKVVETWANNAEELASTWPSGKLYAVVHDMRFGFLSPYARQRAEKIAKIGKERKQVGRYAVIVSNNVFGQAIRLFVNFTLHGRSGDGVVGQCFTSREAALAWVRQLFKGK